jgi:hypothetical protein
MGPHVTPQLGRCRQVLPPYGSFPFTVPSGACSLLDAELAAFLEAADLGDLASMLAAQAMQHA